MEMKKMNENISRKSKRQIFKDKTNLSIPITQAKQKVSKKIFQQNQPILTQMINQQIVQQNNKEQNKQKIIVQDQVTQKKSPLKILLQLSRLRSLQQQINSKENKLLVNKIPTYVYFPPSCCGFQLVYSKFNDTIYAYGGFSCAKTFNDGLQPYFYQYQNLKWVQVKPVSEYLPMPRYGHTLTINQTGKQIVLFGGVSQYKQKLKDRCFYSDISVFHIEKQKWKLFKMTGPRIRNRKNHTAGFFGKNYLVYGGIDDTQQVLDQLNWISLQCKKLRWKNMKVPPRFNHKMSCIQNQNGKQYLCIYGGRNAESEILTSFLLYNVIHTNGSLTIKSPITVQHSMSPRQMTTMNQISAGKIFIMGGTNQSNQVVEDCWFFNCQKQTFSKADLDLDIKQLRGCKATPMTSGKIFVLAAISTKYKALQIHKEKQKQK